MVYVTWIVPALLTEFFTASQDAWVKRHFSKLSTYDMMAFPMAYSLPLFYMVIPFVAIPALDRVFLVYVFLSIPINGLDFMFHMRAIKASPISLTLPYLAFTPVFIFFYRFCRIGGYPTVGALLVFVSLSQAAMSS